MAEIKFGKPVDPNAPPPAAPPTPVAPPAPGPNPSADDAGNATANAPATTAPNVVQGPGMSAVKDRKFPCKGCGADLHFAPGQDALVCPNCGHLEKIPVTADEIKEYSYNDYLAKPKSTGYGAPPQDRRDAKCPNCAAQIQLDANVRSTKCPYCGSPMITDDDKGAGDGKEVITPEALVPFLITQKQAEGKFSEWLGGLWFAPSALSSDAHLKSFQGVYKPFWTYDSHTISNWTGQRGDYYYTTETYTENENGQMVTKTRQVQHTRWTFCSGTYQDFFDDVLVASGKTEDKSKDYDLKAVKHYAPEYLSGFAAERYTLPLEEGWKRAKTIIDTSIHASVCRQIGGDVQNVQSINTAYNGITYKHILLPIWLNSYRYGDTPYIFEVNGQTGKATGTRPYSGWKIAGFVALILTIILILVAVFGSKTHNTTTYGNGPYNGPARQGPVEDFNPKDRKKNLN